MPATADPLPPTFLIVGAMKGGTTSLHAYMAEHPDVCMSRRKETDYFIAAKRTAKKTPAWYRRQFRAKPDAAAFGEASPNYTKRHLFAGVPEAIREGCRPGVKLIYVVRDPAARAVSHWGHNVIMGREDASAANLAAVCEKPDSNYVKTSSYAYQLEAYLRHWPLEQVLVVRSEELRTDTAGQLRKCFAFVGVDPSVEIASANTQLHVSAKKLRKSWLERHVAHKPTRGWLSPILPASLTERQPVEVPKPTAADLANLREHLRADADRFRALTGVALAGMDAESAAGAAPIPLRRAA